MNLQQLNQSGQTIQSFVVTAIIALLITGLMWFCLEQYNSIVGWKREGRVIDLGRDPTPKRSIALRVARALGLIYYYDYEPVR